LGSFFCDFWEKTLLLSQKAILDIMDTGVNAKNQVKKRSKSLESNHK